jgi:hypothetical protein
MFAVFIFVAISGKLTTVWSSQASAEGETQSANSESARIGVIVLQTDEDRCERMKFDNDTGRTIENFKSCDNTVILDSHGVPVPLGTLHRLDAISRSFIKH